MCVYAIHIRMQKHSFLADVEWELLFTDEYESKDYINIRWSISSGLEKKTTRKKNGVNKVFERTEYFTQTT